MWNNLFSWGAVWIVVATLVAIGGIAISVSPPRSSFASWIFSIAVFVVLLRLVWWIGIEKAISQYSVPHVAVYVFVVFGGLGAIWVLGLRGIDSLRPSSSTATAPTPMPGAPTAEIPTPGSPKAPISFVPHQLAIDASLPVVVKIHIFNTGWAEITNVGKVRINDIRVQQSWHVLKDLIQSMKVDFDSLPRPSVGESSYSSGAFQIYYQKTLNGDGDHTKVDLNYVMPFKTFPPDKDSDFAVYQSTYYLYRFTFRDVRTGEQLACYKVSSSYLNYPGFIGDDIATAGPAPFQRYIDAITPALIAEAKTHYNDGAKDIQCSK